MARPFWKSSMRDPRVGRGLRLSLRRRGRPERTHSRAEDFFKILFGFSGAMGITTQFLSLDDWGEGIRHSTLDFPMWNAFINGMVLCFLPAFLLAFPREEPIRHAFKVSAAAGTLLPIAAWLYDGGLG